MTFGVTSTGFNPKSLQDIQREIQDDMLSEIGEDLDFSPSGPIGQQNGIYADQLREAWEVLLAVYRSHYPDSAENEALEQVSSYTGVQRLEATPSTVTLDQLYLDGGVTIPAGSIVSVGPTGARFVTLEDVTNSGTDAATVSVTAEAQETGPLFAGAGTIDTIQTGVSGWSAAAAITCANAEPYNLDGSTLTVKVDRGAEQTVTFSGGNPWSAASVTTEIRDQTTGIDRFLLANPVRIASTTEGKGSSIQVTGGSANTVLGFDTAEVKGFNSADAELGTNEETDPELRLRRVELLRGSGKATVEAIRAAVREVEDVAQVLVIENTTLCQYAVTVQGGDDTAVANALWDSKPAGVPLIGTTSVTINDSEGQEQVIKFSRPVSKAIYISCNLTVDPDIYPADGDDQVKEALVTQGATIQIGEDVIALTYKCVPLQVPGVLDVPVFQIDLANPPTGTVNISIPDTHIATFDTSNISVTA